MRTFLKLAWAGTGITAWLFGGIVIEMGEYVPGLAIWAAAAYCVWEECKLQEVK